MNHKCVLLGLLALIFAVIVMGNCSDVSDADDKGSSGSMNYEFTASDGKLTISGSGDMPDYKLSGSTKVTRPWEDYAQSIKTVSISGVTSVGKEAFYGCSSLTSVTIVDNVKTIGKEAFSKCGSLTSVKLGSSVKSIGEEAFSESAITDIDLGTSVESIGQEAFYACGSLKSITIPTSVTTISQQAFLLCSGLTEISIPDNVKNLGSFAFRQCGALKSIHFGKGITSVPEYCCYGCGNLTSVTFSDSLKTIGNHAFQGCKIGSVTIPNKVTYLGESSFSSCPITSVDIPASVETLGSSAFNSCTKLKSVTLHDGLKAIKSSAFNGCTSLESIIIPDSVTDLGYQAVYNCSSLKEVSFPLHLNAVRTYAGENKSYHVFGECNSIEKITFTGTGSGTNYSTDSGSDTYYQNTPWYTNREHLTEIIWKCNNLQSIGSNTFRGLTALTTVTIGENILSIEDYAFYGCSKLQTITPNDKIVSIGSGAFGNCSSLTSITVPDSVLTIGANAFGNCSSLTFITVGSGIKYVGADAFKGVTFYGLDGKTVLNADADGLLNRTFSGTVSKMVLTSTMKYTVKFVTDSSTFYECHLEYNSTIIAPTGIPTKDKDAQYSYTFEKWDGFTEGMTVGTEDVTFEAVFTKTLNKYAYSVVFTTGSRTVAPTVSGTADYGTVIDISPVTVAGYTAPAASSLIISENTSNNYLAYWYTTISYTLTFDDDVTQTSREFTVETTSIDVPDVTEKRGYSGTWGSYDLSVLKSRTIKAEYTPITYTLTFNDGSKTTPVNYTIESTPTDVPKVTEKRGYTGEWETYSFSDLESKIVNAVYTPIPYILTFDDGVTQTSREYTIESTSIDVPDVSEKKGYTGTWGPYDLSVLESRTVEAVYTPIIYTLYFTDGSKTTPKSYTVETTSIDVPSITEKRGYSGVWESYSLSDLETKVVNAVYTPIPYTLTFDDGVTQTQKNYTIETISIDVPDVTEKKGYTGEWESYDLSVLGSRTVEAVYTPITYTLTFDDGIKQTWVEYTIETVSIDEPAPTEKTGYTGDWEEYDLKDLGNRTIKAQYTANTYHVSFVSEGKIFYEYNLGFENTIVCPTEIPTKDADIQYTYTFQKWNGFTEGMTMTASDISFDALFESHVMVHTDADGKEWIESDTDISLSAEQIESIKTDAENNSNVTLTLSRGDCKVIFDNTALTRLKTDSDTAFSIENVSAEDMTHEVWDIVRDNTLYSISFGSNTDFGNGTVTVTVPYEPKGTDPSGLKVCCISDGRIVEELGCTYDNGTVTFETKHFSLYAIMPSEEKSNTGATYLIAALVVVFAIIAAGILYRRRSF